MKIYSTGMYYEPVIDRLPELKPLLKAVTGQNFRRIDRFIQLALIGVSRCSGEVSLPIETAIYLTSGQGDLEVMIDVLEQMLRDGKSPKPLSFINTVSNSACYHLAKYLHLKSRNCFVASHCFSFERALRLAMVDFLQGNLTSALVGSVDICVLPLAQHRQRIAVSPDTPVAEACHWLLLGDDDCLGEPMGEVEGVEHFGSKEALLVWLAALDVDNSWSIAGGHILPEEELVFYQELTLVGQQFQYRKNLAYYDTQTASAFSQYLEHGREGTLLHIETDGEGRYCTFLLKVF